MKESDFNEIIKRKGYGVESGFSKIKGRKLKNSDPRSVRNVEPSSKHEPLAESQLALNYTGRPVVSFKVYRKRLTDMPRSDCEKYIIDSLRYAGLIRDDSEKQIRFQDGGHEKVDNDSDERVEISITYEEIDTNPLWIKKSCKQVI